MKFPADFVLAEIAGLHVREFSSTSTKLIACPCAVTGRSIEKGDIIDIPGTSGPLHTAAFFTTPKSEPGFETKTTLPSHK